MPNQLVRRNVRAYTSFQESNKPVDDVFYRNLVVKDHKSKDILRENEVFCELEQESRNFKGPVLAYVTPVSISLLRTCRVHAFQKHQSLLLFSVELQRI